MQKLTKTTKKDLAKRINSLMVAEHMVKMAEKENNEEMLLRWKSNVAKDTILIYNDYGIELPAYELYRPLYTDEELLIFK